MSFLRTAILLAGLTALFMAVGYLVGGPNGALIAFFVAAATNFFAYWNADRLVLRMQGAQEVDEHTAPELVHMVAELAGRAGLPMPRVYIMDNPQPNAFATGRNPQNAAVAATTGLLNMLSHDEVAGVISHELAHIKNRDTLLMTVTVAKQQDTSLTATQALVRIHESSKPYGIGPSARPGVQTRHGNAHHSCRIARLRTDSMPSSRTNRDQSMLRRSHNNK